MKNMLRTKDGEEILFYENMRVLDCEIYTPDEQMRKDIFEGELRSVTVTVYEGTNKLTYTQSIAMKGGEITIYLPTSYEQVLYLDEECTQVYTGGEDLSSTKEFILYAKSPK